MSREMELLIQAARTSPILMGAVRVVEAELNNLLRPACDWDQESYCTADDCMNEASHHQIAGLCSDGTPVYELVCCKHARP